MFLDIFVAQELCTTESGNTNHRRSCFLPCNIIRTMPPLECANFLECENKTVCVAPFDLPHGSSTICFSSHTRKLSHSPCWAAGLLIFFGQNGLERDSMWNYRRLRWELHLPHIPEYVIPDHFSQKKRKKKVKNVSFTEYEDFMECTDLAECDDLTVWVPPQLWSAMPSLECEKIVECEEFRVCVAGIETT